MDEGPRAGRAGRGLPDGHKGSAEADSREVEGASEEEEEEEEEDEYVG